MTENVDLLAALQASIERARVSICTCGHPKVRHGDLTGCLCGSEDPDGPWFCPCTSYTPKEEGR